MDSKRKNRINSELQKQIYKGVKKFVGDYCEGVLISVSRVDVTEDLVECKVYLSVFTVSKNYTVNEILKQINEKNKEIREFVAHNIKLRYMPKLIFIKDEGEENAAKVDDILTKIKKQDIK